MLKKIKEYFKNTDRLQILQDFYALFFIVAGSISAIYLTVLIARCIKK